MADLFPGSMLTLDGEKYMVQDSGSSWGVEMPDASTLRFEVQAGDQWYADPSTKNRSEIAMQGVIADATPTNVSYGMEIEPGASNTAGFCMLGQFHQAEGTAVSNLGPPFSIQLVGEKMSVVVGYTDAAGANVTKTIFMDTNDIVRGHYYAMNVQVTFDPNGNGHLVVTRDGLTLVSYTGPLGYQGENGVYWKEGIYRAAAPETMAADYTNLSLTASTPVSSTGSGLQSYTQYDSAGYKSTSITNNADGSTTIDKYSSGNLVQSSTAYADGSRDVYDYGVTGYNYVSDERVYNAAGALIRFAAVAGDGSKTITDHAVSGKSYSSDQLSYNTGGVLTSALYYNTDGSIASDRYNSAGALVQYNLLHSDGSRDVYDYGVTGQNYAADHRVYNAAGTLTQFLGIGADGSRMVYDYAVTGKSYTSDQMSYNASGVLTSAVYYNTDGSTTTYKYGSSGAVAQISIVHGDGSHDVYDYGVTGQNYASDHRVYNTAGTLTEFVGIGGDGSRMVYDYAVTGKSFTSDQLSVNASGVLTSAVYYNTDGSTTTDKYGSSGAVTQITIVHADGSHDVYDYGVTGQSYVSDHRVYNTAGTLTQFVGMGADGAKLVDDYAVTGKSFSSDQLTYNASGGLTAAVYHNIDGSTTTDKYSSSGSLTQINIAHADGSRDVYDYGVTGQSYVADHRIYNAAAALTEFVTIASGGSEKLTAYAAGVRLTGGAGNDVYNSFGGDGFVFKGSFGNDVVNYFHPGDATGHDVIQFAASAVADFAHLAMAQVGSNVVITVDSQDSVTLTGVKLAALTAHDFLFS